MHPHPTPILFATTIFQPIIVMVALSMTATHKKVLISIAILMVPALMHHRVEWQVLKVLQALPRLLSIWLLLIHWPPVNQVKTIQLEKART